MNEKIFRDRWWSISILRRNKRNKDKEIPRAGWKNVNQEDNNNNKIRRRRVSREIILQILFPRSLENLAGSYTEYGINGIQGTCRILDPTQTSERKFRPRFLVEFSPSLSLSRPRAEKDNRGCSLNGKKAGIKWRWFTFTWCIEAWGWKMRRSTGGGPWTVAIFPREYRTRIEKRALFHSSRFSQILGIASKLWNCVRLFSFFSFASFGELDPSFEAFEDLILVEWWKKWKFFWEWVEKENCQVER